MSENPVDGIVLLGDGSLVEESRVNANATAPGVLDRAGVSVQGNRNMLRDNQLSGNDIADVRIESGSTYNVLSGNTYCIGVDFGSNNVGVVNSC